MKFHKMKMKDNVTVPFPKCKQNALIIDYFSQ